MKITAYMTALLLVLALGTVAAASNGVTDFTGGAYDRFDIGPVGAMNSMEGESAGGLRAGDAELNNGVTVFSGGDYDLFDIIRVPANSATGESGGGMREEAPALHNGITDFSGTSLDREDIAL
jgi:hypothetical protein